jgi:hypothetical protein
MLISGGLGFYPEGQRIVNELLTTHLVQRQEIINVAKLTRQKINGEFVKPPTYFETLIADFTMKGEPSEALLERQAHLAMTGRNSGEASLKDAAMNVAENRKSQGGPGGIDLNPAQMSIQVKKDGQDFKFNFNGTEIEAAQVTGATFTIRAMTPVTNLSQILDT